MQFVRSFRQKPLMWTSIAFIVISSWIVLLWEPSLRNGAPSDRHIRSLGMFLQLIGALTVWYDLTHTASGYGHGPSLQKAWAYFKSIFITPPPVNGAMAATLDGVNSEMRATVSWALDPSQPLKNRVEQLEQFVQKLEREIGTVHGTILRQKSELTNELKRQTAGLKREIQQVEVQLEHALIGNFRVLGFGILWLMVGIVVASLPVELLDISLSLGWYKR